MIMLFLMHADNHTIRTSDSDSNNITIVNHVFSHLSVQMCRYSPTDLARVPQPDTLLSPQDLARRIQNFYPWLQSILYLFPCLKGRLFLRTKIRILSLLAPLSQRRVWIFFSKRYYDFQRYPQQKSLGSQLDIPPGKTTFSIVKT